MNKRFLFRAKPKVGGDFVFGDFVQEFCDLGSCIKVWREFRTETDPGYVQIDPTTVGRYLGPKDK